MACKCGSGLSNTGTSKCEKALGVKKKAYFVETYDSTGAKNGYDTSVPLDQAALDALVNHSDATKRWFPVPTLENVTMEGGEPVNETSAGGNIYFLKNNPVKQKLELWDLPKRYAESFKANRCVGLSVFYVTVDGDLVGGKESGTILYPKEIDPKSFSASPIDGTDTTVGKIMVEFNYSVNEYTYDESFISNEDITADLLGAVGLIDFTTTIVSTSTTAMVVKFETTRGAVGNKIKNKGLLAANFVSTVGGATSKLRNVNTGADVSITSVTEVDGVYTLAYTAQTVGNVLTVLPKKNKYSFTAKNGTVA